MGPDRPGIRFRDRRLRRLYERGDSRGLPPACVKRVRRMLLALETVRRARDVRGYPGWRLHKLRGNRRGFWAASVSANERLVFRFQDGRACDVELTDYH